MVPVSYLAGQLHSLGNWCAIPKQDASKRDKQADENGRPGTLAVLDRDAVSLPGLAGLALRLLESEAHVEFLRFRSAVVA